MSKDVVSDALNQMMNSLRAKKNILRVRAHSKVLLAVLALAKLKGYVKHYKVEGRELEIELANIHNCKAIKPRYAAGVNDLDKYAKRYLPAYNLGIVIISTNKGIMTHLTAKEKNLGGSLLAYMY